MVHKGAGISVFEGKVLINGKRIISINLNATTWNESQ
jgi:hypothetical protein